MVSVPAGRPHKATCVCFVFSLSLSLSLPGRSSLWAPAPGPHTWQQSAVITWSTIWGWLSFLDLWPSYRVSVCEFGREDESECERELPRDSLVLDFFPSLYISCTGVVNKLFLETSNRSALESLLPVVTSTYRSSFVPATDKTKQKAFCVRLWPVTLFGGCKQPYKQM